MIAVFEWQFGGWLRHWSAPVAWSVLGTLAVGGAIFVAWMYRRTLRALPPGARVPLTVLRAAIVLIVVLCLANPVRVERRPLEPSARDTLAVVVDRSDSMTTADHRGVTRLASATQLWKQHEAQADKAFSRVVYRHFAVTAAADADLDAALRPMPRGRKPTSTTRSARRSNSPPGPLSASPMGWTPRTATPRPWPPRRNGAACRCTSLPARTGRSPGS